MEDQRDVAAGLMNVILSYRNAIKVPAVRILNFLIVRKFNAIIRSAKIRTVGYGGRAKAGQAA
jgi:hypothetical protein